MSEPFVGQIRMVGFPFTPVGYLPCDGSVQPIANNEVLYNLLGTTYGGDGVNTFGLPDLRGRVVVNQGQGNGLSAYALGQLGGAETVTLSVAQTPAHNHPYLASNDAANKALPAGAYPATTGDNSFYTSDAAALTALAGDAIGAVGGQAHENRMPLLCINFIIASEGIYPSSS